MRRSLRDQVVLITGAARGIGAHTARLAAARGARLALVGLEPAKLQALAAELDAAWFEADVTRQSDLDTAIAGAVDTYGRIDAVVANAGVANLGTVPAGDIEALARTIEVNLTGVMRTVAATVSHVIAAKGYYLLVASTASFAVLPGMAAYCASKAGVEHFGHALRLELRHLKVRVGTAHPAWIDTDMVRDAQTDLPTFQDTLRRLPWPLRSVTPVEACAKSFVDALERRRRRIYVPRTIAGVQAARALLVSPLAEAIVARRAAVSVPLMEAEARSLGRSFGVHSTEVGREYQL